MPVLRLGRKTGPPPPEPDVAVRAFVERNIAKGRTRYGKLTPPSEWPPRQTPSWLELFVDDVALEMMPEDAEAQLSIGMDFLRNTAKGSFTIRDIEFPAMRIELVRDGELLLLSASDDLGMPVAGFEAVGLEWRQVVAAWEALSLQRPDRK